MKRFFFPLFLIFIKICSGQSEVLTTELIENKFPGWYSLPFNCNERPSYNNIDSIKMSLNNEINRMDILIEQKITTHKDSLYNYYNLNTKEQSELDNLLRQWKAQRNTWASMYLYSNDGSGRGILQLCFYRDYTKNYLLILISIYP